MKNGDKTMEELYALIQLFGDRYINVSDAQAQIDVEHNRDQMIAAYNAITHYAAVLSKTDKCN